MHQCWKFGETNSNTFQDIVITMFRTHGQSDLQTHRFTNSLNTLCVQPHNADAGIKMNEHTHFGSLLFTILQFSRWQRTTNVHSSSATAALSSHRSLWIKTANSKRSGTFFSSNQWVWACISYFFNLWTGKILWNMRGIESSTNRRKHRCCRCHTARHSVQIRHIDPRVVRSGSVWTHPLHSVTSSPSTSALARDAVQCSAVSQVVPCTRR